MVIAGSHWEARGGGEAQGEHGKRESWAVTYFAKTMFTPAGIDVYARTKEGLSEGLVEVIKKALGKTEHEGVKGLVGGLFEVWRD